MSELLFDTHLPIIRVCVCVCACSCVGLHCYLCLRAHDVSTLNGIDDESSEARVQRKSLNGLVIWTEAGRLH